MGLGYGRNRRRRAWTKMLSLIASFVSVASAIPTIALEVNSLEAKAIDGRWRSLDDRIVVDIGRCGQGYCGKRVNLQNHDAPEGPCDPTVLNVKLVASDSGALDFEGKFDLGDGRGLSSVSIYLLGKGQTISVLSREVIPFMSRTLPLMEMERIGEAACLPTPIS